jgi:hypothetical protein
MAGSVDQLRGKTTHQLADVIRSDASGQPERLTGGPGFDQLVFDASSGAATGYWGPRVGEYAWTAETKGLLHVRRLSQAHGLVVRKGQGGALIRCLVPVQLHGVEQTLVEQVLQPRALLADCDPDLERRQIPDFPQ